MARQYGTVAIGEIDNVDFSEVLEEKESVRKNLAETEFVVSYEGNASAELVAQATLIDLTHAQILTEMDKVEWADTQS